MKYMAYVTLLPSQIANLIQFKYPGNKSKQGIYSSQRRENKANDSIDCSPAWPWRCRHGKGRQMEDVT